MKKGIIYTVLMPFAILMTFSFVSLNAQESACKSKSENSEAAISGSNVAVAAVKNCQSVDSASTNHDPKGCTAEQKAKCASEGKTCATKSSCGSKASADASKAACGSKASADAAKACCSSKASADAGKAACGSKASADASKAACGSKASADAGKAACGSKASASTSCSGAKATSSATASLNEESFMNRVMLLDSDSDGRVSKKEYMAHYVEEFNKAGKNDQGLVSRSDFAMLESHLATDNSFISMADYVKAHESLFESLDKNYDGYIDGIDIRLGIIDSREAAAEKREAEKKSGCSTEQKAKCGQTSASTEANAPAATRCCSRH